MKLLNKKETKIVLDALWEWIDIAEYEQEDSADWTLEEHQNLADSKKLYARLGGK